MAASNDVLNTLLHGLCFPDATLKDNILSIFDRGRTLCYQCKLSVRTYQ